MAEMLSVFATPQGWIELITLAFLEIVLGIDNLVFISITTARLPKEKQHIGRRVGLAAAMIMRCILLCCIVWLMSFNRVLLTLPFGVINGTTPISVEELIFILGGAYLIYKSIVELRDLFSDEDEADPDARKNKKIGLARAVTLIMVMDIVFSLDSVITAAGLSGEILVMCIAVILAVTLMIVFADIIANFINENKEIKVVALCFVGLVGIMLLLEGFFIEGIGPVKFNVILYTLMVIGLIIAIVKMRKRHKLEKESASEHNEESE